MFFNFKRLKTGAVVVLAVLSLPVSGQDLLARQAPIDKKMRAIDSVALQRLVGDEQLEKPAFGLYPDWNNQYAHRCDVELPEEYKIDLRHSCMPTPSTRITSITVIVQVSVVSIKGWTSRCTSGIPYVRRLAEKCVSWITKEEDTGIILLSVTLMVWKRYTAICPNTL